MKQSLGLFLALLALLQLGRAGLGHDATHQLAYGGMVAMALPISATFLWLWWVRATPLALGMAFSWAGASLLLGWWWLYHLQGEPGWMVAHPALLVFLALYGVGAALHFQVMRSTMGLGRAAFWLPLGVLIGAVALVALG